MGNAHSRPRRERSVLRALKRFARAKSVAVVVLATVACFGSVDVTEPNGDNSPTPSGGNTMSATIDGVPFTAFLITVTDAPSLLKIVGIAEVNGALRSIQLYVRGATTGTLLLGEPFQSEPGPHTSGWIFIQPDYWITGGDQSGPLTVTTLTADRIAGTFAFDAKGGSAQTNPPVRHVTGGKFDVRF